MKKNKILGLSFVLLSLVVIYASTYAYYMRVVNGTISANTGAFTFDVLYNNASFKEVDLAKTTGDNSKTIIVPGDKGNFDLVAKATGSNVDIEYTIVFNSNSIPSNMKFYLDENKTKVLDIQTNTIEGVLLTSGTMEKTHTIYWEWPYDSGRYNDLDYEYQDKIIEIGVDITGKQVNETNLVYGVKRDTSSTSTAWERIEDSIGLEANAVMPDSGTTTTAVNLNVKNDFDNIYPWSDIRSYNYDADKRKVTAWYGDSNFTFDGSNGEVLTYIPGFYYKREVVNGIEYQYISKYEQSGYSYSEPFSVGRYKMSGGTDAYHGSTSGTCTSKSINNNSKIELMMSGGGRTDDVFKARSVSGVYPSASATIGVFRESASTLGTDFSQMDYHWYVLQMLYLVEYADYDVQAKLGKGVTENDNGAITMGGTDELGMKSGCIVNDGKNSSIYRGMEDLYSNVLEFIDGINIKDYQAYINYDFTTYWSDTFDGNYKQLGYVNKSYTDGYVFGFITKLGYDSNNPLIGLPTEVVGTGDADYEVSIKDGYGALPGNMVLVAGGAYSYSNGAGLWYFSADNGSAYVYYRVGSRLIRHQTSGGRGVTNPQEGTSGRIK